MSFDVFLIESTATPPPVVFQREVREAIAAAGGRIASDGALVTGPDGSLFELYGGGFSLTDLTPATCKIIFSAAQRTNAYIISAGGGLSPALKIRGTPGQPPRGGLSVPVQWIADPQSLCVKLGKGFDAWSGYARAVHNHLQQRP
jgi:hypothetical protein